jgi:hemoglobin/transferrin/lactoferrin receptor protein
VYSSQIGNLRHGNAFVFLQKNFVGMRFLYSVLSFLFMGVALSAQTPDSLRGRQLNEVVVTAHRSEQSAFETPATIYALGQKQLKSYQPRTTPEALTGALGVFVQKTTHGAGSPFVRGLTGNQTLLLIDGIRLNNSTFRFGPNQYFNTIDAFTVERVEVLAGSGSVQYGSDAIGGTIHVLTTDATFDTGWQGLGAVRWGSAGMEQSLRAEAAYGGARVAVRGGLTLRRFGDLLGGKNTGFQRPSGYDEQDFDLKAKFLLPKNLTLTLAHQHVTQQSVPVFFRYQLDNFALNVFDPQKRRLTYAKLSRESEKSLFREQTLTLSYQQTQEGRQNQRNGNVTRRFEDDRVKTWGLNLNNRSDWSRTTSLNTGMELYSDHINSQRYDLNTQTNATKYSRGLYPDGASALNYSIYSLLQSSLGKRLTLSGGLRYNGFVIDIPDATIGNSRLTPSALVGQTALSVALAAHSRLFAGLSSGFRAPNVDDLGTLGVVDFRYEVPTGSLQPEKSLTTELGYKLQTKRVSATLAYYRINLTNLITRIKTAQVISGLNVYQKENTEAAYINGFDANAQLTILKNWQLQGNLSYCFGQNETKNEPVRRIPPLNGRLSTAYELDKWFVRAEYLFAQLQDRLAQGDKDDNRIAKGGTPAWKIMNFYAGFQQKHVGLQLRLENFFDQDYRTHGSGINGAGRSAWLTLTGRF